MTFRLDLTALKAAVVVALQEEWPNQPPPSFDLKVLQGARVSVSMPGQTGPILIDISTLQMRGVMTVREAARAMAMRWAAEAARTFGSMKVEEVEALLGSVANEAHGFIGPGKPSCEWLVRQALFLSDAG